MARKSRLLLVGVMAKIGLLALSSAIFYAARPISGISIVLVFVAVALGVYSQIATLRAKRGRSER